MDSAHKAPASSQAPKASAAQQSPLWGMFNGPKAKAKAGAPKVTPGTVSQPEYVINTGMLKKMFPTPQALAEYFAKGSAKVLEGMTGGQKRIVVESREKSELLKFYAGIVFEPKTVAVVCKQEKAKQPVQAAPSFAPSGGQSFGPNFKSVLDAITNSKFTKEEERFIERAQKKLQDKYPTLRISRESNATWDIGNVGNLLPKDIDAVLIAGLPASLSVNVFDILGMFIKVIWINEDLENRAYGIDFDSYRKELESFYEGHPYFARVILNLWKPFQKTDKSGEDGSIQRPVPSAFVGAIEAFRKGEECEFEPKLAELIDKLIGWLKDAMSKPGSFEGVCLAIGESAKRYNKRNKEKVDRSVKDFAKRMEHRDYKQWKYGNVKKITRDGYEGISVRLAQDNVAGYVEVVKKELGVLLHSVKILEDGETVEIVCKSKERDVAFRILKALSEMKELSAVSTAGHKLDLISKIADIPLHADEARWLSKVAQALQDGLPGLKIDGVGKRVWTFVFQNEEDALIVKDIIEKHLGDKPASLEVDLDFLLKGSRAIVWDTGTSEYHKQLLDVFNAHNTSMVESFRPDTVGKLASALDRDVEARHLGSLDRIIEDLGYYSDKLSEALQGELIEVDMFKETVKYVMQERTPVLAEAIINALDEGKSPSALINQVIQVLMLKNQALKGQSRH